MLIQLTPQDLEQRQMIVLNQKHSQDQMEQLPQKDVGQHQSIVGML